MIEIRGISMMYEQDKKIFDISLTAQDGKVTVLLGPEGAGKSAVCDMICGILTADEGSVLVNGIDMEKEQHSKHISTLGKVDVVVTMGCNVDCPNIPCLYREDWGLEDPTGQSDEVFYATMSKIEEKILDLKKRIGQL